MLVEGDTGKARLNFRKHRVLFADAVAALEDEGALTVRDPIVDEGGALGDDGLGCHGPGIGCGLHLARRKRASDFSTRKATARERRRYEESNEA